MKYICIHGHFYQPPRENPWLGDVEIQESALPWHDWNERVAAECYAPNRAARILGDGGKIVKIMSNYERMSFNFGPTLLSWMERHDPETYQAILDADRRGQVRYAGHGPAIAQVYNHMIMPLASKRDKITQVLWGIQDFTRRFGRFPEGMWLPETAVDIETLEVMAGEGILFTILAPHQVQAWRRIGAMWEYPLEKTLDTSRVYKCELPSGRSIALFFYNGSLAHEIAFGTLLSNGEAFAQKLVNSIASRGEGALAHIATDGETFGHHHKYGDMALAWCLHRFEKNDEVRLTVYGEYLKKFPPQWEVKIQENTSWSCVHGVERWRRDCGCKSGANPDWHQQWRQPLRQSLDWLRKEIDAYFEREGARFFKDPWKIRELCGDFFSSANTPKREELLKSFAWRELTREEKVRAVKLLEMERSALFMYTSCGWFFDDISGIESLQVLLYAYHALSLYQDLSGEEISEPFLSRLEGALSNIREFRNGRKVFEIFVFPLYVDFLRVGAHYAVQALFEPIRKRSLAVTLYDYRIFPGTLFSLEKGEESLCMGQASLTYVITDEKQDIFFASYYKGGHKVLCGVRNFINEDMNRQWMAEIQRGFPEEADKVFVELFGHRTYSLRHLFRDGQRRIIHQIIERDVANIETYLASVVRNYEGLLDFMGLIRMSPPEALLRAAEVVLNGELRRSIKKEEPDIDRIADYLDQAQTWGVVLDFNSLLHHIRDRLEREMLQFVEGGDDEKQASLRRMTKMLGFVRSRRWDINLWKVQNFYVAIAEQQKIESSEYRQLGDFLNIRVRE